MEGRFGGMVDGGGVGEGVMGCERWGNGVCKEVGGHGRESGESRRRARGCGGGMQKGGS